MATNRNNDSINGIVYKHCQIADDVFIGHFSVIGKPSRPEFDTVEHKVRESKKARSYETTSIASNCYIDSSVVIEEGVTIEHDCIIEPKAFIQRGTRIDKCTLVVHGAYICANTNIGAHCVIGGFIADHSIVGPYCRVFGMLLHKQNDPLLPWDGTIENAPFVDENVFIGMGAKIIGGIKIERSVYVCAGAIVTKDVPTLHVVRGINELIPIEKWEGYLKNSQFWRK